MTHKLSSACAETILSYHNSLQQNCFTHKLEPVTSLWCVCVVVCVLCGSLCCFLFGFVFGVFFVVCFLFFVFRFLLLKCDKGFGLCIDPLPVYFCGHYSFGPCTSQLINLICNMLGNMLNDLAEAIRRWTEKKVTGSWQDFLANNFLHKPASRISHLFGHRKISQRGSRTISNVDESTSAHR